MTYNGKKLTRRNTAHNAARKGADKGFNKSTGGSSTGGTGSSVSRASHAKRTSHAGYVGRASTRGRSTAGSGKGARYTYRTAAGTAKASGGALSGASGRDVARPASTDLEFGGVSISRRSFLYGAAGIAALIAAGGIGVAVSNSTIANAQTIPILNVPESAVADSEDFEYYEDYSKYMKLTGSISLPYGTLVWANDSNVAFCLLPTATGSPLSSIGIIDLESLGWGTLMTHAVGESEGYEIYDVRGTSSGIVWTEADILDGNWRVYAASFSASAAAALGAGAGTGAGSSSNARTDSATSSGSAASARSSGGSLLPERASSFDASAYLEEPVLLSEGGPDWEMPTITAWGGYAYWQELPKADGSASSENSLLRRCIFGLGASSVETVYESPGRMACALSSTQGGIVFAPRAEAVNVYYQLTYIDGQTAKILDQLTLPASMRPAEISYGDTGFSFAFDGIYSYGGGIANLGTYTPRHMPSVTFATANEQALSDIAAKSNTTKDQLTEKEEAEATLAAQNAVAQAYSDCEWFRFARTPLCPPAWCNGYFMVKSSSAIVGASIADDWYFALPVENGAPDYGEFMASEGAGRNIVTYTQINYTPINGNSVVECRMKIWEPA